MRGRIPLTSDELGDQLGHALGTILGRERLRALDPLKAGVGEGRGKALGVGAWKQAVVGRSNQRNRSAAASVWRGSSPATTRPKSARISRRVSTGST